MDAVTGVLHVSEVGILALFGAVLWRAWRGRKSDKGREFVVALSAFLFAFAFEDLNVITVTGRGSYFYNPRFTLWLDQVPFFIVAAWAVILWSAMTVSEAAGGSLPARCARDAMLAVLLDIGFDTVAVRYGMWTWRGVALDEAWFGVPAGNFFGWLWVSLAFSVLTRGLVALAERSASVKRSHAAWQLLLVPLLGLGLYKAIETTTFRTLAALHWTTDTASLLAFWAVFGCMLALASSSSVRSKHAPQFAWLVRGCFHAFSVCGVLLLPPTPLLQRQRPILLTIASLLIALEIWTYWREYHRITPPHKPTG